MNNTGKILTAIAAGVTAGAILGVLFAPDKGSETRRKIADQKNKITDDVINKFRKGKDELAGLKMDIEKKIKNKVEEFA